MDGQKEQKMDFIGESKDTSVRIANAIKLEARKVIPEHVKQILFRVELIQED